MKQIFRKLNLAALVIVGAMTVGCTGALEEIIPNTPEETTPGIPEETQQQPESKTVTLTTTISIGTETKALDAEGVKTFAVGDQIAVVYEDEAGLTQKAVSIALTAEKIREAGKKADITVSLTDPKADGALRYIYPAAMALETIATNATIDDAGTIDFTRLDAQDGTLATLASNYDLAVYDGNLTGTELPASATLENQLAIGEFTIKDKDESSTDITSQITRLTVSDGTNTYTVSRAAAAGPIYVAMKPVSSDKTITLTAVSSAHHYLKALTGKALAANKMYPISVDMPEDMLYEPLTIVATEASTRIYVHNQAYTSEYDEGTIKYTINDGEVQTIEFDARPYVLDDFNVNSGDIVRFYGDNATYYGSNIFVTKDCYIYGNVMSLISSTEFATTTTLTEDNTFEGLFNQSNDSYCAKLKNHPSKALLLPATTLTEDCYAEMFSGCTGLTTAPVLPATTLAASCYYGMFSKCTGLTTAPALPATTMVDNCYRGMFQGCTSLATAPALPATTLADNCYMYMFNGCTSLTSAPTLPAETMKRGCYYQMFYYCTQLTTAPALPATTLASECYSGMFSDCTGLTTAPALPATALAEWCYDYMFNGCTSLTTAPDLPATTLAPHCYAQMFSGCTSLTTAPVLSAPTLATSCYYQMFRGCTKLNSVTCLATDISAGTCTYEWLDNAGTDPGVTSRQFYTPLSTSWESDSVSGIPKGWTRINTEP